MEINSFKLRWIFLLGFFLILALPLFNIPPWFSPPAWGKTIVFRIILSFLIFLFIYQVIQKKDFSVIQRRVTRGLVSFWLLISLFGIFLVATIFSLDPYFSFFGSPYRAGGFLNFAFYIFFAILAFLIIKKQDWQKIWNFAFIVGILVCIIAIFQQFNLFSEILISVSERSRSTLGNPILLAIYLLLLSFLVLSFGLKDKSFKKKLFYFLTFALFLFTIILITKTRAAFIGLSAGFFWFIFFYPKRLKLLKISALILLIVGIFGFYFLKTHPDISLFQENSLPQKTINRILTISPTAAEGRISGWKVSFEALKARPFLGYGPENFSIGFDKYYDPSLPGIVKEPGSASVGWWDRGHNFLFDIGVSAGIPALIIYLSFFGVLFWQLQRLKYTELHRNEYRTTQKTMVAHGVQATFIAYLTANLFSFDTFSTYLVLFLLIGYSLHLISSNQKEIISINQQSPHKSVFDKLYQYRKLIIFTLFVLLIWFIWAYNLKPLQINKEINWAEYYSGKRKCEQALEKIENILPSHSFLDHYLRLEYADIIRACIKKKSEKKLELSQKATQILKENIEIRPYYTRDWLLLGAYTNYLIGKESHPELIKGLKDEANYYLERANQLSPKRQEVFRELIKTHLSFEEYQKAKEKAQKCIDFNPRFEICWWYKGLAQIYLNEIKEAQENIKIAGEKGYLIDSKTPLLHIAKAYGKLAEAYGNIKDYQSLVEIYQKLINLEPNNYQYHSSLATVYKEFGQFEKARSEALIVLELSPESREVVEEFLRTLY